jgi:hypothetical protein
MQSLISKPKKSSDLCRYRRAVDLTPEVSGKMMASVNSPQAQNSDSVKDENNSNGFIIVKKGEGVYYVRYDIIFAKAGDIFFMPRKVPNDFSLDTDKIIPFEASAGEFEKFYNQNYRELIDFANLSESLQ